MLKMKPVAQTDEKIEENDVVRELAIVLRSNGEKVLSGETKLALTSSALGRLNEGFQQVQSNFSENLDSHFLYDFVQKTYSLKLSRGSDTLQGDVNLSVFNCLKALEIKRVPLHLITGLQSLRPHLIAIDCHRCLGTLQELFASCGGDRSSEFAWNELISAKLSFNDIKHLDNSLKLLPNLVSLNLSHNLLSDTTGLEYLPQLRHLNLSYNLLKEVPRLSSCAQSRLNYLSLSNNNVESLKGVEVYQQLQHLDVTYNCILDHCCLSISSLKFLQNISLLGNPLCYKRSHRANVVSCLHSRCLSEQFCVDGQVLSKQEIAAGKSSPYLNTLCGNDNSCPNVNHHLNSPTFEEVFDADQMLSGSSINLLADTEVVEIVPKQIRKKKPKDGKRVRKTPAFRDIIIDYPTHEEDDEGCEIASVSSSLNRTLDKDVEQTKQEIEYRHKQYGESWLVIENNLRVLNAVTDQSTAIVAAKVKEEVKSKRISQSSDDIIVLATDGESIKMKDGNFNKDKDTDFCEDNTKMVCKEVPVDEMSENEKEDDESADLNPFIVQREKPGTDVLETIMVIITDTDIREKHVLTAKTFQRLDLCSIQSVTKFQVNSDDGQDRRRYAVKVTFNYMKKDKRERVYRLEDMDSYQSFVRSLEDAMHATTLKNMTFGALQCLKCSSQFSKHVAKQVVLHPSTSNLAMPSSVGSSHGYLNEPTPCIMMCPNCDSQLIVELDENSAFPDTTRPISTLPTHLPDKYTSPKSTFPTDAIPVKADFTSSEPSGGSYCCNEVIIKAEVHVSDHTGEGVVQGVLEDTLKTSADKNNSQDFGYPLRRNGSDITILSNPSQSSIVVVHQGKMENVIDNSFASDPELNSQQDQMVFNIYDGETPTNQQPFLSPTSRSKVGSSSSGSMTGSVCTAREQNLSEPLLKSPPGTPLTPKKDFKLSVVSGDKVEGSQSKSVTGYGSLRYSFADMSVVDHRIQLYLDMHVLIAQEECLAVVKSAVVPYGEKEWTGLIVLTNLSVHLLKIVGKEGLRVETWLKHVDSHPLLNLHYITSCLGSQAIRLEFTRKNTEGKCYTMLLRDADRTNAFVSFISDKFQEPEFGHLQVEFQQNADETMSAIAQQLLGTTNSEACEELLLYMMCHWKGNDEDFEPVSIVVTESHIYVAKENMLFPKPVVVVPSTRETMTGNQFTLLSKQSVRDLTNLEQYADQQTEINIKFVNEDKGQETCWSVRAETSASLVSLVDALKTPWERLYEVDLHVAIL